MATVETNSIQENSLQVEPISQDSTNSSMSSGHLWTAIRYAGNIGNYYAGSLKTLQFFGLIKGDDLDAAFSSGPLHYMLEGFADVEVVSRLIYSVSYFAFATFQFYSKWDDNLSDTEKQEMKDLFVKRLTNASSHMIRFFGSTIPLCPILLILYDTGAFLAPKDSNYPSFWSSEPIGNSFKQSNITNFDINSGKVFGKKLNRIGTIPLISIPIGYFRMWYSAFLQVQATFYLIKNSRNQTLDQKKVQIEFQTNSYYNLAHFYRGLGEFFTIGLVLMAYDYFRASKSEEFQKQNPQLVNFLPKEEKENKFYDVNSGKIFGKKANIIGMIPIIGMPIGIARMAYASALFAKNVFDLAKSGIKGSADYDAFLANAYYDGAHALRGFGELFLSIGCYMYELPLHRAPERFRQVNPHLVSFFPKEPQPKA